MNLNLPSPTAHSVAPTLTSVPQLPYLQNKDQQFHYFLNQGSYYHQRVEKRNKWFNIYKLLKTMPDTLYALYEGVKILSRKYNLVYRNKNRSEIYTWQKLTYPSFFPWFFFFLLHLKVVSRSVLWLRVTPGFWWHHKSGFHRQFVRAEELNITLQYFQKTFYSMFLELKRRLEQTIKITLGFTEHRSESSHVFSVSQYEIYHHTNNRGSKGQKFPILIWNLTV